MEIENYKLHKLKNGAAIPFDLLLLANETKDAIERCIYHSAIYRIYERESILLHPKIFICRFRVENERMTRSKKK